MRRAAAPIRRGQVSRTLSVPAPVGGWNARDSLAEMAPADAVILDNFFCTPFDVRARFGYSQHVTGISGTVNTLMSYSPPSGGSKLFAAAGSSIYDVSTPGAVGAAVKTGISSDKYQKINFGTSGGNYLVACNGADAPLLYNGTAWSSAAITGVTASNLISVCAFKSRLFFIEQGTLNAWYLPTSSIGGAASKLDFSSYLQRGGYLMAMAVWTLDAGYGMDDYMVFISSQGEVLVYSGTDPASATTWSLIGSYQIGTPIGRRCVLKYQGDVLIICKEGLAPLSKTLMSSRVNTREMLTDKIQHVVSEYTSAYSGNFGWQILLYPDENMLMVNVPVSASQSEQLVMNTISGAWSRFTGWNASCWELHNDNIYFGTANAVGKAWDTYADNGLNINIEALQSFNFMSARTALKQVKMLRPIIATDGSPAILLGVNADFDTTAPSGVLTYAASATAKWDSASWDLASWAGDPTLRRDWQTGFALGYCFAAHLIGTVKAEQLRWSSTDYVVEAGGVI